MDITVIEKNGKKFATCVDEGFEHPVEAPNGLCDGRYTEYPPRSFTPNTMTPYDKWVGDLCEVAEDIVSMFHYEGRVHYSFKKDMSKDEYTLQLWEQIKRLAAVLKEGDE